MVTLVQNEYITNTNEITEKLNGLDNVTNITLENHLNTDIGIFEVGLEGMMAKKKDLDEQLKELKKEEVELEQKNTTSQIKKMKKE